ncbi:MAG: hypothetical protein HQK55_14110, partial [Deltaproteobacteria bacterium]|nr:hypothetical protein [Deltaproteobacteria bacterium]
MTQTTELTRSTILAEPELPRARDLLDQGRQLARRNPIGPCAFLNHYQVPSEAEYKRRRMAKGEIMFHAQVGYREPQKSLRACREIYEQLAKAGYQVDRYGICLDFSMGYPTNQRPGMPKGTGLILNGPEDFAALTAQAPVAFHFGDFVLGLPSALENTVAAVQAGATTIGNLGQYFTFRLPHWHDDVFSTAETVKALGFIAAQPAEILIHSNLDDGFVALYRDLSCGIGQALLERYIIEELCGGIVAHCYGHVFSEPLSRLAFQIALSEASPAPGSMIYGNTTSYIEGEEENYANLAGYLLIDLLAQQNHPTGHGLNPVPVTEAVRIPEIKEIIAVHLFANRLAERAKGYTKLIDFQDAKVLAARMLEGGHKFKQNVLAGLAAAGVDTGDALEMLLTLRRLGARRLEDLFGPGQKDQGRRKPLAKAATLSALESLAEKTVANLSEEHRRILGKSDLKVLVACTDVHEYGKLLLENVLSLLGVMIVDGGVSADPEAVANKAGENEVGAVAISTYNGVALNYLNDLRRSLDAAKVTAPIFIGGKLNQIPSDSLDSLPVDVSGQLETVGAMVCHN